MNNNKFELFFYFIVFLSLIFVNEFSLKFLFSDDNNLENKTLYLIRLFDLFIALNLALFLLSPYYKLFLKKNCFIYSKEISKFYFQLIKNIFKNYKNIFLFISIILFSIQITSMTIKIYNNSSYFDVVKAEDMDSWDYAKITEKSSVLTNHRMLFYGPVYPKISKIIKIMISDPLDMDKFKNERLIVFSLNFLNIVSILLICYLISIIFSSRLRDQIFFSYIMFVCFQLNSLWSKFLAINRLDIFFTAIVCLIIIIKIKSFIKKSDFLSYLSYFMGGLAFNIKAFYLIFLPGLAFFDLMLKKKIHYYISCLVFFILGFVIFGFPESIIYLDDRIKFINKIKSLEGSFTLDSISFWLINSAYSFFPMIFAIIIFTFFSDIKKIEFKFLDLIKSLVIIVLPFFYFSKKVWQPTEHYILPITVTLFVVIAFKLKSTNVLLQIKKKMNTNNNIETLKFLILIIFTFLTYTELNKFNAITNQIYEEKLVNEKNYKFINQLSHGKKILVDAYVPYDSNNKNISRYKHLALTHKIVNKYQPNIVVINTKETSLLLDKKNKIKYAENDFFKDYNERYNFYKKLFFKESFAHENQKWTLVKKDKIIVWNID